MRMNAQEKLIDELISYESETEWFEFKRNWFKPDELGEYISALANAAAAEGKNMPTLYGESMMRHMKSQARILSMVRILRTNP